MRWLLAGAGLSALIVWAYVAWCRAFARAVNSDVDPNDHPW